MNRHTTSRGAGAILAISAVFLVAACSDDDAGTDPSEVSVAPSNGADGSADPGEGAVVDTGDPVDSGVPVDSAGISTGGTLTIQNLNFSSVTAGAGGQITIDNLDDFPHTVTSDDGAFDEVRVDGGSTGTLTIDESGTYAFHCEIHSGMAGTIVIE